MPPIWDLKLTQHPCTVSVDGMMTCPICAEPQGCRSWSQLETGRAMWQAGTSLTGTWCRLRARDQLKKEIMEPEFCLNRKIMFRYSFDIRSIKVRDVGV